MPSPTSLQDIVDTLRLVKWTMDGPFHMYDSISYPQTVWATGRDDCDGFAVLAARLLRGLDPSSDPELLTVMMRPVRDSHTVCVFKEGDALRFFSNARLDDGAYGTYGDIANEVLGDRRLICWDVADPETLRAREFHR